MYLPQRVARCAGRWVGGWVFLACCEICALEHDLLYRSRSASVRRSTVSLPSESQVGVYGASGDACEDTRVFTRNTLKNA